MCYPLLSSKQKGVTARHEQETHRIAQNLRDGRNALFLEMAASLSLVDLLPHPFFPFSFLLSPSPSPDPLSPSRFLLPSPQEIALLLHGMPIFQVTSEGTRVIACPATWCSWFRRPLVGMVLRACWAVCVTEMGGCPRGPPLPHHTQAPGGLQWLRRAPRQRAHVGMGQGQERQRPDDSPVRRGGWGAGWAEALPTLRGLHRSAHLRMLVQASTDPGICTCACVSTCVCVRVNTYERVHVSPVPAPMHASVSVALLVTILRAPVCPRPRGSLSFRMSWLRFALDMGVSEVAAQGGKYGPRRMLGPFPGCVCVCVCVCARVRACARSCGGCVSHPIGTELLNYYVPCPLSPLPTYGNISRPVFPVSLPC